MYRAKLFIDELKEFEKKGTFPNLVYLFLPCDHTNGTRPGSPTPRAMVADNDLALGQVVEACRKSKFWPKTCIFVVEDDPQNGFDHVDGHRTVGLVISPYTKRKCGRLDQLQPDRDGEDDRADPRPAADEPARPVGDADAELLQPTAGPDAVHAVPNRIPLDEMNKPLSKLNGKALDWAQKSLELEPRRGGPGRRGHVQPHPVVQCRRCALSGHVK